MKLKKHRNLFNGDCTFLFFADIYHPGGKPYDASVLHRYVDLLAESGVDTFLINGNAQVPWYPSKVTSHILTGYTRGDRDFFRGYYPAFDKDWTPEMMEKRLDGDVKFLDRYLDLYEAGVDWMAELAKQCRKRHVSPWASLRMNDMHGANNWSECYMNCAPQRDPRFRLSGQQINPKDGVNPMQQSLNYAHKEVRDYMLMLAKELINDYDFDGLELDWMRQAFCLDAPASQKQTDVITEWHAEIRRLTRARVRKTGKPHPLGVRIPCRLGQLRAIGLDIRAMAKRGIIDFVAPSNGWQTSWDVPYDELRRELGDEITIYGVVEDAPNWLHCLEPKSGKKYYRLLSTSAELLRGNAAGKLALGADGIEQFNFFCSDEAHHNLGVPGRKSHYAALRGLHDLKHLRGKPKHYALATRHGYFMFPLYEYAEQVPFILEPEWKHAFRLSMCAEPNGSRLRLFIQLVVEKKRKLPDLGVSFNGCWPNFAAKPTDQLLFPTGIYTHHLPEHRAFNYEFEASQIHEGWNEILVFNGSHTRATPEERIANSVCIVSLELAVKKS